MKHRAREINLLPKEYIQAQKVKFYGTIAAGILCIEVILFIALIVIPPKMQIEDLQNTLDEVSFELSDPKFEGVNKVIQDLENAKVEVGKWMDKYKSIKKTNVVSGKTLDTLTGRIPSGVNIDKIDMKSEDNKDTITIDGKSENSIQVLNYVTILETIYGAQNITFDVKDEADYATYNIKIEMVKEVVTTDTAAEVGNEATPSSETTTNTENTEGGVE